MATVGSVFSVKHQQNALTDVLAGVASAGTWWHVPVLIGWGLVEGLLAVRLFRWQPHVS